MAQRRIDANGQSESEQDDNAPQSIPVERGRVRNMVRMFENQSQPTPPVPRPQPLQRIPPVDEQEVKDMVNEMIDKIEQEQSAGARPQDTVDLQEIKDVLDQLIEDTEQILSQTPSSAPERRGQVRDLVSRFEIPDLGAFDFLDDLEDEPLEEYDDSIVEYVHPKRRAQSSPYLGWQLPSHGPIPLGYGRDSESSEDEDEFGLIQMYEPDRHIGKQEERLYPGPRIEGEGSGSDDDLGLKDLFDESGQPEGQYPGPPRYMPLSDADEYNRSRREGERDECVICLESEGECFESCECPRANGNWYHYECVADRIIQTTDAPCTHCGQSFWDPLRQRIERNYQRVRQTWVQILNQRKTAFVGMGICIFLTVFFYFKSTRREGKAFALIFFIIEMMISVFIASVIILDYYSQTRNYRLTMTFKEWPEENVYPNNTRVVDIGIVRRRALPNEQV